MAQYVRARLNGPKIIDFIDVDSEKWRMYAEHRSFPFSSVISARSESVRRNTKKDLHELLIIRF